MKTILQKIGLLIAVLFGSFTASAYDFEVDGIYYNVVSFQDMTCEVTSGDKKYTGDVVIPSEVTYNNRQLSVISIGGSAFRQCREMTSVIIPNSVVTIGGMAFYECGTLPPYYDGPSLTNVTIGENVTSIGGSAFECCNQLTRINIPNSVTSIGKEAFKNCYSLTNISLSESLNSIEESTFENCSRLESITIPNTVTTIEDKAFSYCRNLTKVFLGESVSFLGTECFYSCESLESIAIPDLVTSIGDGSFDGCKLLENITLGQSISNIGKYAFCQCESLKSVIIPNSVKSIGEYAFKYCKLLEHIDLSNQLTELNAGLFQGCVSLKSLALPGSVTSARWFYDPPGNYSPDYVLLFGNCKNLREISFLNGVDKLEVSYLCTDYKSSWDVNYWPHLEIERLYIDRDLTFGTGTMSSLGDLKELTLGPHCTSCPYNIPRDCENLEIINCYSLVPPTVGRDFSNAQYMNVVVKVPQQALEAYQHADVWKNFWNIEGFEYSGVDAEMISLNIHEAELNIGETIQLEATVLPEDTTDKTLEWKSSNEEVAIVDASGLVTAINVGSATITVTCGEASAQCEITVIEENGVESIFVNPNSSITIYSTDGIIIKKDAKVEDLKTLVKGIYIIVSGENRYKVSI